MAAPYYCEVCFALPLPQSFTYLYHPQQDPKPLKSPKNKKSSSQTAASATEESAAGAAAEPEPLVPVVGQRVFASLGRSKKEGWIISVASEPPESLCRASAEGKSVELKELAIAEPKPLFGERELQLARWLSQYYICSLGEALGCLLPTGKKEKEPLLYSSSGTTDSQASARNPPASPEQLSPEQQAAVAAICRPRPLSGPASAPFYYLFGPTGSGKTEVFLQCMARVLQQGLSAIYLVPEISLCYQLQEQLESRFAQPVALLHSHLSAEQRLWYWRYLQEGRCRIVLGARSAVFAPASKLGLIVLDEEHEQSYKAGDTPRYHARQVAMRRCRNEGAILLMGSATPSVEAMQASRYLCLTKTERAEPFDSASVQSDGSGAAEPDYLPDFIRQAWEQGRGVEASPSEAPSEAPSESSPESSPEAASPATIKLLRLSRRLAGGSFPVVEIVDLRRSKTVLSEQLLREIEAVTRRGDQAILFLNRRGYSPIVECFSCGKVQECRHCSVALTYHKNLNRLKCHQCGFSVPMLSSCGYCHRSELELIGFGTEQIEEELERCFAHLRSARLDTDVSRKKGQSRKILNDFRNGRLDLLVGTQMVAKGLNFERVKLVGVVLADTSLNMPDFRAAERSFSLLVQVAGRAGRFSADGKVLIQTYQPQSEVIGLAASLDWQGFYRRELELRRLTHYPPYSRLIRLVFRGTDLARVKAEALLWQQRLRQALDRAGIREAVELFPPCECPYFRVAGKYRFHILLRSSSQYFPLLHRCTQSCFWQARGSRVYVEVDVDPSTMM